MVNTRSKTKALSKRGLAGRAVNAARYAGRCIAGALGCGTRKAPNTSRRSRRSNVNDVPRINHTAYVSRTPQNALRLGVAEGVGQGHFGGRSRSRKTRGRKH